MQLDCRIVNKEKRGKGVDYQEDEEQKQLSHPSCRRDLQAARKQPATNLLGANCPAFTVVDRKGKAWRATTADKSTFIIMVAELYDDETKERQKR